MIITCPNCNTRYQVPDTSFSETGRKVRCQSCRFIWHSTPEPPATEPPAPEPTMEDEIAGGDVETDTQATAATHAAAAETQAVSTDIESAAHDGTDAPPSQAHAPGLAADWKGWLALAACLALVVGGAYEFRQAIVTTWPAAARAYALVGVPVNALGIEFANIRVERDFDNGLPVLSVAGEVINVSGQTIQVPRLRVALRDRTEREIYRWTVAISSAPLKANARARFATRLAAPPEEARAVFLRFEMGEDRKFGLLE